jgi:signal transduction histidine kinase/CheY-like chemotaxis protein
MRILLADDQIDAATPLRDFLKDNGHEAELVDSAEKALARVIEVPFDFVLMDQYFPPPGMDGIEAITHIRDVRPGQRVIILTAYGDLDSNHRALDAGAYRYIFTPCEQETILAIMQSAQAVVELERALTEHSTLLRVLDEGGIGISVIDRSFRILYMNKHQQAISRRDAKRGGVCWIEFNQNLEARSPCPWCPTKPAMDRGEAAHRITTSIVEGKLRYSYVVASPVKGENGEILAAVEFVRDITEEYEAEQKSLSSMKTDDRLLATLMRICSLGYGRARLYELSEDRTILRGRAEYGDVPIPIQEIEFPVEEDEYSKNTIGLTAPTIYSKGQLGDTLYNERIGRQNIEQWIDVPLLADGQCVGKITVDNKKAAGQPPWRPKPSAGITDAHFPYIQLLAESAARDILHERQLRKMTEESKRLEKLRELAEDVASPSELRKTLVRIVETCVELIGVQGAHLRLLEGNALVLAAGKGPYYEMVKETRPAVTVQYPVSGSVRAWMSREEVIEPDARRDDNLQELISRVEDPASRETLKSIESWACFPILVEGTLLGVLELQSERRAFFGPTTRNAVKDFVGMIVKIDRLLTDLERAQRQLKMAARAAVHQVNNPNFATQLLVTNWLKMRAEGKARLEAASAVMKAISDNSTRIANLGERLRRFLKGPETTASPQAVELQAVVQRATEGLLPTGEGYVVNVTADPGTPAVHVDRLVLAEIFGELAANARKAMNAGGTFTVSIRRARREEIVEENLAEAGEYARAEVRDSGPGIAPDKKKWVFEPFHGDFLDGTGLGLSVLRDTLTMMGGTVREAGEPGEGARFVLTIPVYPTERRERA